MRTIADCERVLCAAPDYSRRRGTPETPHDLIAQAHNCLLLRFPGSREYFWTFATHDGPQKITPHGAFDADDADILTDWALQGAGIVNRPRFELARASRLGRAGAAPSGTPPVPVRFACLYPHRRLQDPKVQAFIPWMVERCRQTMRALLAGAGS